MSRHSSLPDRVRAGWGALLLVASASVALAACDDDGKTLPATCPELPLYNVYQGGDPGFDDPANCFTKIGHAVNQAPTTGGTGGTGGSSTAGSSTGGSSTAGSSTGGAPADAGAGGA